MDKIQTWRACEVEILGFTLSIVACGAFAREPCGAELEGRQPTTGLRVESIIDRRWRREGSSTARSTAPIFYSTEV